MNFDFVSSFYDGLARVVFGSSLEEAYRWHLQGIDADKKVLIVGGGTGKILEQLKNQEIFYVEKSKGMLSKINHELSPKADFIKIDYLDYKPTDLFDYILFPFFLDCFHKENLMKVLGKARTELKPEGKLIVTDFDLEQSNPLLLRIMHLFFIAIASLESKRLKDLRGIIRDCGFEQTSIQFFRHGIFSGVYTRAE